MEELVISELKKSKIFNEIQRINSTGAWELELDTDRINWTEEVCKIHEVDTNFVPNIETAINFYYPEDRILIQSALQKTIETGEDFNVICRIVTAKNNLKWVKATGMKLAQENIVVGTFQDITERKNEEKKNQELYDLSQNQNERLRNFSQIVAHNLKSHSGGISSLLQILKDEHPELFENEIVNHLTNSSQALAETIEHLSDVVQINLNSNDDLSVISIAKLILKNTASLHAMAIKHNVTIEFDASKKNTVLGIKAYLDSIIFNFITNAIKYSEPTRQSYLKIQVEKEGEFTVLSFEDNGIGIDLEKNGNQLYKIYKTFNNNVDARGIGLFISKNQIEAMNGKIEVKSTLNVGTTFKIYLKN